MNADVPAHPVYRASEDAAAMWDFDLTAAQRSWRAESAADLWHQVLPWKSEVVAAVLEGREVSVVWLTNGADPRWDWRTVAFWANAVGPGWRVHLRHESRIDLIAPPVNEPVDPGPSPST